MGQLLCITDRGIKVTRDDLRNENLFPVWFWSQLSTLMSPEELAHYLTNVSVKEGINNAAGSLKTALKIMHDKNDTRSECSSSYTPPTTGSHQSSWSSPSSPYNDDDALRAGATIARMFRPDLMPAIEQLTIIGRSILNAAATPTQSMPCNNGTGSAYPTIMSYSTCSVGLPGSPITAIGYDSSASNNGSSASSTPVSPS